MRVNEIKNKKNKMNIVSLVLFLIIAVLLVACSRKNENSGNEKTEPEYYVYYIDKNETKIVGEPYKPAAADKKELVKEYFEALSKEPKDISLKSAKPESLKVNEFTFNEDNDGLSVDFNSAYNNLTGISEVLFRACVVKTLCQIDGVDDVEFYVEGQPLKGLNDQPISFMKSDDFIDDTSAENVYVTVYFANENGNKLVATNLKIPMYDGNISVEKLILESLIAGPENIKNMDEKARKTVPDGTKLISASTKDGICYVDLNEKFLDKIPGIKDEVAIYSVVNSLVELSTINKVQFLINGDIKKNYREDITLDNLFERNLDLVEGSK